MKKLFGFVLFCCLGGLSTTTGFAAPREVYGLVGDAGFWNHLTRLQRDSLLNHDVTNLILLGDHLYDLESSYSEVWSPWITKGFDFTVVTLGNHHSSYSEEMEFFRMPAEYYSYTTGVSRFIVLNSDNTKTVNEQARWLQKEINRAKEKFIFVVFHHPPYTITERHGWEEKKDFHQKIRPLLQKYHNRITALMVGHDHVASLYMLNSLPMIISGASFENFPSKLRDYQEGSVHVKGEWTYKGNPHWARLDVIPDSDQVWVSFIDAKTQTAECAVRLAPRPTVKRLNCRRQTATTTAPSQEMR